MIKELLDGIQQRLADGWHWIFAPFQWLIDWSPMLGHFALFFVVIVIAGFLSRFLPDKAKMWLLVALGFIGAFLAGEVNQYRKRLAAEKEAREAEKELPPPPPRPQIDEPVRWNPFGKW